MRRCLLLAALCLGGCSEPLETTVRCSTNAGCDDGRVCRNQRCVVECYRDEECVGLTDSGLWRCEFNRCVDYPPGGGDGGPMSMPDGGDMAVGGDAAADGATPDMALPVDAAPDMTLPVDAAPDMALPVDAAPDMALPVDAAPDMAPPVDAAPDMAPPADAGRQDMAPPADAAPADAAPADAAPADAAL
ncbi:MAG: hypothetical protein H6704_18945 [Myxococcales bacterium]|nr:hypothetical protein [Myxococcales bacterium]